MINSLCRKKKFALLSTLLAMVIISVFEGTVILSVYAENKDKGEPTMDTSTQDVDNTITQDVDNTITQDNDVPVAKMVYGSKSYKMLPFVVVENEDLKRLNFPHLPDDFSPEAQVSSDDNISFSFITKPREMNAFLVDYDADTTEMTPLHREGKNQFSFGDVYGPRTLELRVIYPDGKYVTYTCLIDLKKSEVKAVELNSDDNGIMNSNDNIYSDFQSNDPDSSAFGQISPQQNVAKKYDDFVGLSNNEKNTKADLLNTDKDSTSACQYSEIPIKDIETDSNNNNSDENSSVPKSEPRWAVLDLGEQQNICALKVSFANVDNEIKFFTLAFSDDGENYTSAEYYTSTGTNSPSEIYDLKEAPIPARFIKITELDMTESIQWISDLIVLGNMKL